MYWALFKSQRAQEQLSTKVLHAGLNSSVFVACAIAAYIISLFRSLLERQQRK